MAGWGSAGAKVEKLGVNHFQMTLGHTPEHPDWANNCQLRIKRNARGNALVLDVRFEHPKPQYLFDEYFHSWSYDGAHWQPIHWAEKSNGKKNRLVFPVFEQDQVDLGLQVPMTAEEAVALLQGWAKHPHVTLHTLGQSLGGRPIYRMEITDPAGPHPRAARTSNSA